MKVRFLSEELAKDTCCLPDKAYDVVSIEIGWYDGCYKVKIENGEEALVNPDYLEIVDIGNPPPYRDPLMTKSNRSLMTSWYKIFLSEIHSFTDNPSVESAIDFVRFIDDFWFYHKSDLYSSDDISAVCEYIIVFMIRILCEGFDDYDQNTNIYDHYCTEAKKLYDEIIKKNRLY